MARLDEFAPWTGQAPRLCDRCDALMASGWMADQVFLQVYICRNCHKRQVRASMPGKPPRGHHKPHDPRPPTFPELPPGVKMPVGILPRLEGLAQLKKAGKMEAYARVRKEIAASLLYYYANTGQKS